LIKGLKKYSKIPAVAEYLKQYEEIKNRINSFRGQSISNIYNNAAILLEMDRIFKDVKNRNIINACGFYYGPDSVSSLIVSYSIVRNSVKSFYINILQMANFDRTFKKEIEKSGKDWYYSAKLHEVKDVPFKTVLARAPNK
jgi:hypothetical protein